MKQKIIEFGKLCGALAAIFAVIGGVAVWAGAVPVLSRDLEPLAQQVAENTRSVQLQRWQYLNQKKQAGGLTPDEQWEYCQLSEILGFQGIGCA